MHDSMTLRGAVLAVAATLWLSGCSGSDAVGDGGAPVDREDPVAAINQALKCVASDADYAPNRQDGIGPLGRCVLRNFSEETLPDGISPGECLGFPGQKPASQLSDEGVADCLIDAGYDPRS